MSDGESTVLGRLLEELSWEGDKRIKAAYRSGGRGQENVLAAEILMPLDFLPRSHFLGEVIGSAHGAEQARTTVSAEIEEAGLSFLDQVLVPSKLGTGRHAFEVQPDAQLISPSCHVLVEAKRMGTAKFMATQLSREYVTVLREAGDKTPLLLLILGSEPPVSVDKHGRQSVGDAIRLHLEAIDAQADTGVALEELHRRVDDTWAWITWHEIGEVVARQAGAFANPDASVVRSVARLSSAVARALAWHA